MPTVYVDRPFLDLIREERDRKKREIRRQDDDLGPNDDVYVPESDGLERLLSDEANRRLKRYRENHG